ncbi:MAG: HD domain-containing protein [Firmicutes bacterium]|nr:HD domain-containing protein [Bacillota bacterium]
MEGKADYLKMIKSNPKVEGLIIATKENLDFRGFNAHGFTHANFVANETKRLLLELGYTAKAAELAAIAGYMHDIGCSINREKHAAIGAALAFQILSETGMPVKDVIRIVSTIGNHDENADGLPINEYCAALIIVDKCDIHRSRIYMDEARKDNPHYKVNFATEKREIVIDTKKRVITLALTMNSKASLFEMMEIYSGRFQLCQTSAKMLKCEFKLLVNGIDIMSVTGCRRAE